MADAVSAAEDAEDAADGSEVAADSVLDGAAEVVGVADVVALVVALVVAVVDAPASAAPAGGVRTVSIM